MIRACIYCHTYSAQLSCDSQITLCTKYVESLGWELVEMYVDEGTRVEFKRMLKDSTKDIFDFIVTQDLNRITLEHDNILKLLSEIKPIEIIFIDDNINTHESIELLIEAGNKAIEQRRLRNSYSRIIREDRTVITGICLKTILKHARLQTGLTQKGLSDKIGITKHQYARLERGDRNMLSLPAAKVELLLEVLSIDPEAIKDYYL